jgi:hypothetical protein
MLSKNYYARLQYNFLIKFLASWEDQWYRNTCSNNIDWYKC